MLFDADNITEGAEAEMIMLLDYGMRIMPAIMIIALTYVLMPKKSVMSKLFLLIMGFLVMRDAMTPLGLWRFGSNEGVVWFRFIEDGFILAGLAFTSLVLTCAILFFNQNMSGYLQWFGKHKLKSAAAGVFGAVVVTLPILFMYMNIPGEDRGGTVAVSLLAPLFVFTLLGNFMEEVLFRGYVQGYFETLVQPWRAAVISGFLFSSGHIFLAVTVTDLGWPILVFTLYEGLVCAFIRKDFGIIAASLTHGLGIFILASGLI